MESTSSSKRNGPVVQATDAQLDTKREWIERAQPPPVDDYMDLEDPVVAALADQADNLSAVIPVARLNFPRIKVPKVEQVDDHKWKVTKDEHGAPVMEVFSIRIRALQRRERLQCERLARDEAPQRLRNRLMDREVDVNEAELRMLYTATVREDRDRFWDSSSLRSRYRVGEGWELIGKMLTDTEQITAILALYDLGSETQVEQQEILSGS